MTEENIKETQGGWHKRHTFGQLNAVGMITGCGLMQLTGVTKMPEITEEYKKQFQEFLQPLKNDGCGTLICTLGQAFYEDNHAFEPKLFELGFKQIAEYNNIRHMKYSTSTVYNQRLYILTF